MLKTRVSVSVPSQRRKLATRFVASCGKSPLIQAAQLIEQVQFLKENSGYNQLLDGLYGAALSIILATNLPQAQTDRFRQWRISAGFGRVVFCGKNGPEGPFGSSELPLSD